MTATAPLPDKDTLKLFATRAPWLHSPQLDTLLIVGPGVFATLFVLLLCERSPATARVHLPLWVWLLCVVGIDVAHVWSTLFRTYLDADERDRYGRLLWSIPLLSWIAGAILYSLMPSLFWSCLAYLAVFHFVRQQYGFYALYARYERMVPIRSLLEKSLVYLASVYPLLFWHAHLPREFIWFIEGDFLFPISPLVATIVGWVFFVMLLGHGVCELLSPSTEKGLPHPKNLIIWSTAVTWYVGIVFFNADLPFTVTNVIAHGVPYIALTWIFLRKKASQDAAHTHRAKSIVLTLFSPTPSHLRSMGKLLLFLILIIGLAFLEEGLWDALIWRERAGAFSWARWLPKLKDPQLLALIVPLLAVPQATHYVLDAFIWRIRSSSSKVSHVLS